MNRPLFLIVILLSYLSPVSIKTVAAQAQPPAAPSNLEASLNSSTEVLLTWTDNSDNETGFNIYEAGFRFIATVGPDTVGIIIGLPPDTGYQPCYSVTAYNEYGESPFSDPACPAVSEPPLAEFEASPLSGSEPLTVNLHNISTGDYTTCLWDYGDGTTANNCTEYHQHTYSAGSYTLTLTVSGPGGSNTMTISNYVNVSDITYSTISGRVTDNSGNPIPGVLISNNDTETTLTDINGYYIFSNLAPGFYTLTASKSGYTFSMSYIMVDVPPDDTDVNFVGVPTQVSTNTPPRTPTQIVIPTATWTSTSLLTSTSTRSPTSLATATRTVTPSRTPLRTPTKTSTPTRTPTKTPQPDSDGMLLVIATLEVEPDPPKAFSRITLRIIVENKGATPNPPIPFWDYSGKVFIKNSQGKIIETHSFTRGTSSSIVPAKSQNSLGLDFNRWEIMIRTDIWYTVQDGVIEIILNPRIDHSGSINISKPFVVKPNATELSKCFAFASSKFASVLPAGKAASFLKEAKYLADGFAAGGKLATCEDIICAVDAFVTLVSKYFSDKTKIAVAIKGIFDTTGGEECAYRAVWLIELIKGLNDQGAELNLQSVHSPVYILITNRAGQRTGFLDDGEIVEEIPGSWVAKEADAKYIVYPADNDVTTRLKGTGEGIMTFSMILNQERVVEIVYSNIDLTANTVVMIKASEADGMEIDNDGDGMVDTVLRPDSVTPIGTTTNKKPTNWFILVAVVFVAVGGTALIILRYTRTGKALTEPSAVTAKAHPAKGNKPRGKTRTSSTATDTAKRNKKT